MSATPNDVHGEEDEEERRLTNVTCNEGEILLEIKATTGDSEHYDWQVMDDMTGEIFAACPATQGNETTTTTSDSNLCYWTTNMEFQDHVCLPIDGCYRLVTGEVKKNLLTRIPDPTMLDVRYGGEEVFIGEQFQFQSIRLPSSCKKNSCGTAIDGFELEEMEEEELELFLFDGDEEIDNENEFDNSTMTTTTSRHNWMIYDLASGLETSVKVRKGNRRRRRLTYHRQCILGCTEVIMPDNGDRPSMGSEVKVGGIIYGSGGDSISFPQPAFVGVCTSSQACPVGQPSWQVDIDTRGITTIHPSDLFLSSFSPFIFHYANLKPDAINYDVYTYGSESRIWKGEHFRRMLCVNANGQDLNKGCTIMSESSLYPYNRRDTQVGINGRIIMDRIDCLNPTMEYRMICLKMGGDTFIPLNDGCKSKRRIIQISTSVSVAFLLFLVGGILNYKRSKMASSDDDTPQRLPETDSANLRRLNMVIGEVVAIPIAMDFVSTPVLEAALPLDDDNRNGNDTEIVARRRSGESDHVGVFATQELKGVDTEGEAFA